MPHGPNPASYLFLKSKFYLQTASPTCVQIVYGCLCIIAIEQSRCNREHMSLKAYNIGYACLENIVQG